MLSNVVLAAGLVALAAANGVVMLFAAWVVLGFGMALGLYDAGFAALTALYGHNARADYRHHALCRLCLDAELAAIDCPERRAWLARDASGLGGVQYGHRLAAELAAAGAGTCILHARALPNMRSAGNRIRKCSCSLSCSPPLGSSLARWLRTCRACSSAPAQRLCRRSPLRRWSVRRRSRRVWSSSSCYAGRIRLFPPGSPRCCIRSAPSSLRSSVRRRRSPFTIFYGAGNGLLTIACGTVPLAVFGPHGYGERTGLLGAPARAAQALAPLLFGSLLDPMGAAVIVVSAGLCLAAFAALLFLAAPRVGSSRRPYTMRKTKRPGRGPGRFT